MIGRKSRATSDKIPISIMNSIYLVIIFVREMFIDYIKPSEFIDFLQKPSEIWTIIL